MPPGPGGFFSRPAEVACSAFRTAPPQKPDFSSHPPDFVCFFPGYLLYCFLAKGKKIPGERYEHLSDNFPHHCGHRRRRAGSGRRTGRGSPPPFGQDGNATAAASTRPAVWRVWWPQAHSSPLSWPMWERPWLCSCGCPCPWAWPPWAWVWWACLSIQQLSR